jgi:hypothetical protein
MPPRKPSIFFAIPCGEFYSVQHEIIQQVTNATGTKAIIIEDHIQTKDLWSTITKQIDSADLFVADVSSGSFNIALELGYALREKLERKVGIFISENRPIQSDLQGFVRQQYSSLPEFQAKLSTWICHSLELQEPKITRISNSKKRVLFREDFKSQDFFLRHWSTPPGASFVLTHEGLRFVSGTLPILSTTLGLLHDYEVEFRAKIRQERLGWIVKGTKTHDHFMPGFCVMLQVDGVSKLTPHIWNELQLDPKSHYHIYPSKPISLQKDRNDWFTIRTRVRGDHIAVVQKEKILFKADFNKGVYAEHYTSYSHKEGQIGFRCHPGEEAVINYVEVREL